jgi:hypothetical protein
VPHIERITFNIPTHPTFFSFLFFSFLFFPYSMVDRDDRGRVGTGRDGERAAGLVVRRHKDFSSIFQTREILVSFQERALGFNRARLMNILLGFSCEGEREGRGRGWGKLGEAG